ncbi:hypothetical protein [Sutcliffiella rhizosphaerae]|uniref:Uncharacterized protein n=1 Tax=Sutcliffiella rhizosphaerae TaxID=2880967 RepID=A0ABN8A5A8_9BACI|nr:hypothetical protein [Sutcliffiella rhizosphaerae]CAG9619834.1 hypothetical protein BACCIP111883_00602 [Sutcliffiella rhizosphaerae]
MKRVREIELEMVWDIFLADLNENGLVKDCFRKKITGIPFLYVEVLPEHSDSWEKKGLSFIHVCSKKAMFKKKVTTETHFVRRQEQIFVYRHRFFVPQEKMFCCGNLCEDCIRLRKDNK